MDKREQLLDIMKEAAKGETKATLRARIAELEAENERLTKNLYLTRNERDNLSNSVTRLESESLSRTGAVKVKALQFHLAQLRHAYAHLKVGGVVDQSSFADGLISPAVAAIETALSALEPAAPEGQQEPVAWGVFYRGKIVAVSLHKGYHYTVPLYTRPSEQAVTEAIVDAVVEAIRPYTRDTLFLDEHQMLVREALKTAMEPGQ